MRQQMPTGMYQSGPACDPNPWCEVFAGGLSPLPHYAVVADRRGAVHDQPQEVLLSDARHEDDGVVRCDGVVEV